MEDGDFCPSDNACNGDGSGEPSRSSWGLHKCFAPCSVCLDRDGTTLIHGTLRSSPTELEEHVGWQVMLIGSSSRAEIKIRPRNDKEEERTITKCEILIMPPGMAISVEVLRSGTAALVQLSLASIPVGDRPVVVGLQEVDATNGLFFETLMHLQKVCRNPTWVSPELTCSVARVFAILVSELSTRKLPMQRRTFIGRSEKIFKRVEDYLETHLTERISMSELARVAGVSQRQFRRLFRVACAMSPREYLWVRRAQYGKSLLSKGDHNVAEAAVAAGFSDQTHMNRHFRAIYGVPPSAFLPRRPIQPN
jgi:AraC-like DNA-binding protein